MSGRSGRKPPAGIIYSKYIPTVVPGTRYEAGWARLNTAIVIGEIAQKTQQIAGWLVMYFVFVTDSQHNGGIAGSMDCCYLVCTRYTRSTDWAASGISTYLVPTKYLEKYEETLCVVHGHVLAHLSERCCASVAKGLALCR